MLLMSRSPRVLEMPAVFPVHKLCLVWVNIEHADSLSLLSGFTQCVHGREAKLLVQQKFRFYRMVSFRIQIDGQTKVAFFLFELAGNSVGHLLCIWWSITSSSCFDQSLRFSQSPICCRHRKSGEYIKVI